MKSKILGILIVLFFAAGYVTLNYPVLGTLYNQICEGKVLDSYENAVQTMDEGRREKYWKEAQEYNAMLAKENPQLSDAFSQEAKKEDSAYHHVLNMEDSGVMGALEIPKLSLYLPVYHGTSSDVLEKGVGHLEGSSIPIGGKNTHAVLTGHRGLPSSKLLVRLDEMETGDLFFVRVANETLAYRVSDIQVVKPEETSCLKIQPGKDLVSIVTCTPYGINTHRLVVTGERVAYKKAEYERIKTEIPSVRELLFTILPFAFIAVSIGLWIKDRRHIDYENEKI